MGSAWMAVVVIALTAPFFARAATVVVCSACAVTTIYEGLNLAQDGDVVAVQAGNYSETLPAMINATSFTLMSTGGTVDVLFSGCSPSAPCSWLTVTAGTLAINGSFVLTRAGVTLNGGAELIQYADLMLANTLIGGVGLSLESGATWLQHGTLRVESNAPNTVGVSLNGPGTQWTQYRQASFQSLGMSSVVLRNQSVWNQLGDCAVENIVGEAIFIKEGSTWNQDAELLISNHAGYGVSLLNGTWNQRREAVLNNQGDYSGGVSLSSDSATLNIFGTLFMNNSGSFTKGVYFFLGGTVNQYANLIMTSNATRSYGVKFSTRGRWNQYGLFNLDLTNTNLVESPSKGAGVVIQGGGAWYQEGQANLQIKGPDVSGVRFDGGGLWNQLGPLNITISGANACGVNLQAQGAVPWIQNGQYNVVTIGSNASGICPVPIVPSVPALNARFNLTKPSIALRPQGPVNNGTANQADLSVQFDVWDLYEIDPQGNVVQRASLQHAGWHAANATNGQTYGNASSLLVFTSEIVFNNSNTVDVTYTFATFANVTTIDLGNNQTLKLSPQYVKFTLGLSSWPWLDPSNRLQLGIRVEPAFNSTERQDNLPQAGMTTILARSIDPSQASALVRLLNFGFSVSPSTNLRSRVNCTIGVVRAESLVTMTFDNFGNASFEYDPDLSLVLGSDSGGGGGGGSNQAVVIAVAVVVPVALILVALVIVIATIVTWRKRRRLNWEKRSMINFHHDDKEYPLLHSSENEL